MTTLFLLLSVSHLPRSVGLACILWPTIQHCTGSQNYIASSTEQNQEQSLPWPIGDGHRDWHPTRSTPINTELKSVNLPQWAGAADNPVKSDYRSSLMVQTANKQSSDCLALSSSTTLHCCWAGKSDVYISKVEKQGNKWVFFLKKCLLWAHLVRSIYLVHACYVQPCRHNETI